MIRFKRQKLFYQPWSLAGGGCCMVALCVFKISLSRKQKNLHICYIFSVYQILLISNQADV